MGAHRSWSKMSDPMVLGDPSSWREPVLRGVLTVAAGLALPLALATVIGRSSRPSAADTVALLTVGFGLPALRLLPRLSVRVRAAGAIVLLFGVAVFLLGRIGFTPGIPLVMATAAVLGAIYFGRRVGLALILGAGSAHAVIGTLVLGGDVVLAPGDLDPLVMRNWVRIAFTTTLISALLTLTIDVIIRQIETGARATEAALFQMAILHDRLEAAKEDERRFLAHELHDDLGQTLTALKFRVQVAGGTPSREAVALIDDLIARVRKMSVDLRPPLLDEVGLVPALRAYLDGQSATTGVAMAIVADPPADGADDRLPQELEIACFRVVQESITNVLRHAGAKRIEVQVARRSDAIALSIHDDGRGFDAAARLGPAAANGHLGVVGMRERVRGRGGAFALDSHPGAGTRVSVELPLTASAATAT